MKNEKMRNRPVIIGLTLFYLLVSTVRAGTSKPVQTAKVESGSIVSEWVFPGSIKARAEVDITSEAAGRVKEVYVEEGDPVKAGQVLVVIDAVKLDLAVRQAEAALVGAKANYEQTLATAEETVMVQRLKAQAALAAAETNLQQVKDLAYVRTVSQMDQAQVALELAQDQLDEATVRAPASGVIASRTVEVGDRVESDDTLFNLVDVSQLRVSVKVSETDLLSLRRGQEIQVKSAGVLKPLQGTIRTISPTVDAKTRLGKVEVFLKLTQLNIRPGMYAEVIVQPTRRISTLIVPRSAVQGISTRQPYVYVVQNGLCVRREVQVGVSKGGRVEVVQGLKLGEDVIVSGQYNLEAGEKVHIVAATRKPSDN